MKEMRRDPVTRKWVIVDTDSKVDEIIEKIQTAVLNDQNKMPAGTCDFCPGREATTRPTILEKKSGDSSASWKMRVIPNKDPVFQIEGGVDRRLVSIYDVMDALGAHEIIIEHREHIDWDQMSQGEVAEIIRVYQERMNDLSKDHRFGHLFIYKNFGPSSNSTMTHPHSTVIASPSVPERIRRELDFTRRHFQMKERCLFCDIIGEETRRKSSPGTVRIYDRFVTISPFFVSHPFETWILPRQHDSDFRNISSDGIAELAQALQENLKAVKSIIGPLSYSLLLFTRPNRVWGEERDYWTTIDDDYHWHFKFLPRLPRLKGFHRSFSAGSGYMVNKVPPEIAAERLRTFFGS